MLPALLLEECVTIMMGNLQPVLSMLCRKSYLLRDHQVQTDPARHVCMDGSFPCDDLACQNEEGTSLLYRLYTYRISKTTYRSTGCMIELFYTDHQDSQSSALNLRQERQHHNDSSSISLSAKTLLAVV